MENSVTSRLYKTDSISQTPNKRGNTLFFIVMFTTALISIPLLVIAGANVGYNTILMGIVVVVAVIAIMLWPIVGFYIVALSALIIEEEPIFTPIGTDRLNIFYWPPAYAGLIERPIGFLILFVFFVIIYRRFTSRQRLLEGGTLLVPFLLFLLCLVIGIVHGITTGGDFKIIVLEIRPFWYIFVSYLLAYNLITHKAHVRLLFWFVILGAAFKGIQGVYIYLGVLHGQLAGHREIMAHEESFFFVALLLLIILFCLHSRYWPQLYAALLATPCVVIALVANQRRADYIALIAGLGVAWALIFLCKPRARTRLLVLLLVTCTLGGAYVAAFANSQTGFGAPARSIVSVFYPSPQDASSNLYRQIEDADLKYTVKQNPRLGMGFGKQFLQPTILPNIIQDDPYYLYIPHNTIYWVWMRLGPFGFLIFWYLIGALIIRGTITTRQLKDSYSQLVAIYIISVTFMEIIVAYADYQLFFYRNVIYFGILAGILMRLPSIDQQESQNIRPTPTQDSFTTKREITHASANGNSQPTTSRRRS